MNALLLCVVYPFTLNQHIISIHRLSTFVFFSFFAAAIVVVFFLLPIGLSLSISRSSLFALSLCAYLAFVNFSRSFHFNNITLDCKLSVLDMAHSVIHSLALSRSLPSAMPTFTFFIYAKQLISSSPEKYVNYKFQLKRISAERRR